MGVFFMDKISDKYKIGFYVIYFDDSVGSGIYLVVMNIRKYIIECFDSFGFNCLEQVINVFNRLNVNYVYNSIQYQDLLSVLCGYICLYYMDQCSRRKIYYVVRVFFCVDYIYNEKFIKQYFIKVYIIMVIFVGIYGKIVIIVEGVEGLIVLLGLKGDKGDNGLKGDKGYRGFKGDIGVQGVKGDKVNKGDIGV